MTASALTISSTSALKWGEVDSVTLKGHLSPTFLFFFQLRKTKQNCTYVYVESGNWYRQVEEGIRNAVRLI